MKRLLLILCLISIGWTNDYNITNYIDLTKYPGATNIYLFKGEIPNSHTLLSFPRQRDDLQIWYNDKPAITIHLKDGRIELAEHMTTNEAARIFWKVVQETYGTYKTK